MHEVKENWNQTSISWNAVRRKLVVGYRIVKQSICPIFQGSSSSALAVPKSRFTNTTLSRSNKACLRYVDDPGSLNNWCDL